ncbi:MAG TPA: ABC transporter permease [Baekduia sp.]|nr:ABC transporter permease [Baekduia sp.]
MIEAREGRRDPLLAIGEYARFIAGAVLQIGKLRPYAGETLRQAGILALGSTLIIVVMAFLLGSACGLQASAATRALGGGSSLGVFTAFCTTREVVPFIFGFILAAKVGCGIVAELGSMRVHEEVDALEVMGVPSITYLVTTRLVAAMLIVPLIYVAAVLAGQFGAWLVSVVYFADVSQGTYSLGFYSALSPLDLLYSTIKGLTIALLVVSVSLYYGYTVRGGPVEVGLATARSMTVNLVLATLANMSLTLVFWGIDPHIPVA